MGLLTGVAAIIAMVLASGAEASDRAKEKRWAEQIVDSLLDGEAVYLNDGASEFLAIYTAAQSGDSNRGVVVMHGIGVHPDWHTVVQPLRVALAERNWHTLSIQMPVLANEAQVQDYVEVFPEVPGRIDAALAYLGRAGASRLFLLSHSLGSIMTAYYLRAGSRPVDGFVAIGMGPGGTHPDIDSLAHLRGISVSMLDLFGSEDLRGVVSSAPERAAAAAGNRDYTQRVVAGADHFFDGEEELLIETIAEWLEARAQ